MVGKLQVALTGSPLFIGNLSREYGYPKRSVLPWICICHRLVTQLDDIPRSVLHCDRQILAQHKETKLGIAVVATWLAKCPKRKSSGNHILHIFAPYANIEVGMVGLIIPWHYLQVISDTSSREQNFLWCQMVWPTTIEDANGPLNWRPLFHVHISWRHLTSVGQVHSSPLDGYISCSPLQKSFSMIPWWTCLVTKQGTSCKIIQLWNWLIPCLNFNIC